MTAQGSATEDVSIRIITDEAEWDAVSAQWDELHRASPYASTPLAFDWLRSWWRVYGSAYGARGLRVIMAWRGPKLLGALPLYIARGVGGAFATRYLRFISTGEAEFEETCPDYLNLLCSPGEEGAVVEVVWKAIERLGWDQLDLREMPDDSPLLGHKGTLADSARAKIEGRGICPIAELENGFDAYLKRLSAKTRQHSRQYLRAAERAGAVFELATATDTETFFDDLMRLHQERWTAEGKPGVFAAQRFTQFHRELARAWVPTGRAVLARLSHGGQVYAVLYGFVTGTNFDFYQSGIKLKDTGPFESPGTTANLLLMSALAATRGVTHYDFLRGSSSYKQRLATTERRLSGIRLWRPTLRATAYRSLDVARRAARKGLRLLRRR